MLLLTACGKKAEEPSEPTPSESESMPTESEPTPSESETMPSESETEGATEATTQDDWYTEMYDESDVVYAKELTPVKIIEDPAYRIEGYYSTPSEAFAGYPIIHCHGNLAEKPWNENTTSGCFILGSMLPMDREFLPDRLSYDYRTEENGVPYRTEEERIYIDHLSVDSIVFKDNVKIPSAFVIELDETAGVLVELLAITDDDSIGDIDYYFTKVFAYGKLIDISEYTVGVSYLKMSGTFLEFQGDSVYVEVFSRFNMGRMKITEDDISFAEGYWNYFYDEEGYQMIVYDEYGQEIYWGFHPRKKSEGTLVYPHYPDDIILPYWD